MGTDTGSGGFDIDGKAYSYDVGDPDEQGSPPKEAYTDGDIDVDHSEKDLSKHTKKTLAGYLSDLTLGKKPGGVGPEKENNYPIDVVGALQEPSLTDPEGQPPPLAKSPNISQFGAAPRFSGDDAKLPMGLQLPGLPNDPGPSVGYKTWGENVSGDDVLPTVPSPNNPGGPDAGGVVGYTSKVLSHNRFTAQNISTPVDIKNPGNEYDPTLVHPRYGALSTWQLANIGLSLSQRASKELLASSRGTEPSSGESKARALIPGVSQLAIIKPAIQELMASDVLENATLSPIDDEELFSIYGLLDEGSWGTLNNVYDQYTGISALGMVTLSIALTAAVVLVYELIGFLISLVPADPPAPSKDDKDAYVLGRYLQREGVKSPTGNIVASLLPPDIGSMLGINPTRYPYGKAVQTGLLSFFAIDTGGALGAVGGVLESAATTPEFNSIVSRVLVRSGAKIVESFAQLFNSADFMSGLENLLNIIDTLRTSKIIQAMNIFGHLGDRILTSEDEGNFIAGADGKPDRWSTIDTFKDGMPGSTVSQNRLNGSLKLAWSSNRAPAMYMLPDPTVAFAAVAGGFGKFGAFNPLGANDKLARTWYHMIKGDELTGARIASKDVATMESVLEAEYMPFYFHDLRTNEIISFHAFLNALSDDFAANWEQTDAYGRVDPVRIYKSTGRKISVGFHIVSTSDDDFDDMWVKINKLVTMVYPQYTRGRLLQDKDGKNVFVQPFSQVIGASPLVRIRLGELFQSNYSRFALARLFGVDSNVTKFKDGTEVKFEEAKETMEKLRSSLLIKKLQKGSGPWYMATAGGKSVEGAGGGPSLPTPPVPGVSSSGDKPKFASEFKLDRPSDIKYFRFKVKDVDTSGFATTPDGGASFRVIVIPELIPIQEINTILGIGASEQTPVSDDWYQNIKGVYDNADLPAKRVVGGEYKVSIDRLLPSHDVLKEAYSSIFGSGAAAGAAFENLTEFLDPEKNALVAAYEQTRGKGLAGTIDSLNFDWYDQTLWEIAPGRRAPMMCKVTIAFTPIHDVSPGLDHQGYNRAPVYPVGHMAHGVDKLK